MTKSSKTAKAALLIAILTLGSKFLGFLRDILIAYKFGSGMETDVFFIAITATELLTRFLRNSTATTFIPVISEVESLEGKEGKIEHTNNMLNVIFVISIILVIIAMFGAPVIIKILAKGFKGEQFDLAVKLTRIGLPMVIFSGIMGIIGGYLHSEEKFNSTAIMGIPSNLVYIFFLVFLASTFGLTGLMVAATVAVLSQLLVQVSEIKTTEFKYKFIFDIKDSYIKKVLYLSLPVFIGVAINDLNAIVDRTLASSLAAGSISALNYANKLNSLILQVFISAITTVIFPILSKEFSNDNIKGVKDIMKYGINLILLITIPATIGLIVLSKPIVQVAFERGEFDINATIMTSQALMFYSIGLVAMALRLLTTRVYYSLQDTKTPMINGAISVGFNIVLNLIFIKFMAHSGLALATSISTIIATCLMFYGLRNKIGSLGVLSYIKYAIKPGIASVVMGVVSYMSYHGLYRLLGVSKLYNLISLLVAVTIGATVYGVLCYVLGIEEIRDMVDKVKIKLSNR